MKQASQVPHVAPDGVIKNRTIQLRRYGKKFYAALILSVLIVGGGVVWHRQMVTVIKAASYRPQVRTYYIAAEDVDWDYAPGGKDQMTGQAVPLPWGAQTLYHKTRYIEYTDASFKVKKPQPAWLGILGPIIRGVPGDTLKIVFKNNAHKPYSIHPHGVAYTKANEGSMAEMTSAGDADQSGIEYAESHGDDDGDGNAAAAMSMPSTSTLPESVSNPAVSAPGGIGLANMDGEGASIVPGATFTYTWHVRNDAGPSTGQGSSRVWLYHSHVTSSDIYDGLMGAIIITSRGHARADATPDDVAKEFVSLFMVMDESKPGMDAEQREASLKHTINGRFFDTLQGYSMTQGEHVRWHELALGNEVDIHTPHWHGNVVSEAGHTTDVIELLPASMKSVDMTPDQPGTWAYHCHVVDHMNAGMMATYTVLPRT